MRGLCLEVGRNYQRSISRATWLPNHLPRTSGTAGAPAAPRRAWERSRHRGERSGFDQAAELPVPWCDGMEGCAPLLHVGSSRGIDSVPAVHVQLVVQPLGGMGQKVTVVVKSAALKWQVFSPEGGDCGLQPRRTTGDRQRGVAVDLGRPDAQGTVAKRPCSPQPWAEPPRRPSAHPVARPPPPALRGWWLSWPAMPWPPCPSVADGRSPLCQAAIVPCSPVPLPLASGTAHPIFAEARLKKVSHASRGSAVTATM